MVSDVDHCSGRVLVYLEQVTEGSEMLLHLLGAEVVGALHQEPHAVDGDDAHDQEADGAELDTEQEPESGPGPVYTQIGLTPRLKTTIRPLTVLETWNESV